jgi:excisionase family DNA binding protein
MSTTRPELQFESLWDANDVAAYVKASRSWVYMKAEDGTLPSLRIGGLLRFEPGTVRAFARGELPAAKVLAMPTRGTP